MVVENWQIIRYLLFVDAFYTPGMLFFRGIQSVTRKVNRSGFTYAGGNRVTFEEYKKLFHRFHLRYLYFSYGAAGLYKWGNMILSRYTVGLGYAWGGMNFSILPAMIEFAVHDIIKAIILPSGPDSAQNLRSVYVAAMVFGLLFELPYYEILLYARYVQQVTTPVIVSMYTSTAPRKSSQAKTVFANAFLIIMASVWSHGPYLIDLFRMNEHNHEPYMCSLSLHMSMFKVFAAMPFAIYNNVDSPFKNSRALVVLPWILFDFPALILMLKGCTWDRSLTYGVDPIPNLYRVVPLSLIGAAHVWALAILPFVMYDLWKKFCRGAVSSAGVEKDGLQ